MTVQNDKSKIEHTGNGSVTEFPYDFPVIAAEHIKVYLDDVLQGSGYIVQGVGETSGGEVVFDTAPSSGVAIRIMRDVPFTQLNDYRAFDAFPAESHENALDLAVQRDIQLRNRMLDKDSDETQVVNSEVCFTKQVTFKNFAPISETAPSLPEHLVRKQEIDALGDIQSSTFRENNFVVVDGQTVFNLDHDFSSVIVVLNGRWQSSADGAYTLDTDLNTVTLSEPVDSTDRVVIYTNDFQLGQAADIEVGDRGKPFEYDTVAHLIAASDQMLVGQWAETKGEKTLLDGRNATYYLVSNAMAGVPDGFYILDLGDKKGVLMYTAPTSGGGTSVANQIKGRWGAHTHPVANSKQLGDLTVMATAHVNEHGMYVTTESDEGTFEHAVSDNVITNQCPAIEWAADGTLVSFHGEDVSLIATPFYDNKAQATASIDFPATIKDIQVHRVHTSMYIFVSTEASGLWCVNYKQGTFTSPFQFSDFETMRSKSLYEDDIDKNRAPTLKIIFADNPSDTSDKVYFANVEFTPTADGLGSLVFKEADNTVIATMVPSAIDAQITAANAEEIYNATAGHTVYLGDISKEENHLVAIAKMPLVSGLATFDIGYAYDLELVTYDDTPAWVVETIASVVGLEGHDSFAPQLDPSGVATGSYGIEGTGYTPLGICFADLPTFEKIDPLADQRKVVFVTHAGGTYDLRTQTVTTEKYINGSNTLASDNPRIIKRDNNKPLYRPKSYQGSANVTVAVLDSDSDLGVDSSRNAIVPIDTQADIQTLRDESPVTSLLTPEEAASLVEDGSIGPSGGSWWTYPTTIGRQENGQDVVYVGGVYGVTDNNRDDGLAIKGTAVQFVAALTWDEDNSKYVLDKRQLFNKFIVDEHDNPAIQFQRPSGEMVIASNSHADSVDQIQEFTNYNFGKDMRTLSPLNVLFQRSRSTYAQLLSSRFTSWHVQRINNAGWGFVRLTRDGFPEAYSQMLSTPHNYYVSFAELDKERTQGTGVPNEYHCFIAANPIDDEKADIRYLKGQFEVGFGIVLRNEANVKLFAMNGSDAPLTDTDFDVAVSEDPATRRVRLLDIAYRDEGRILYQSMPKSDDLINQSHVIAQRIEVKDVEFSDLKMAWWNGASWQNVVIKANVQGGLGWDPLGDVNGPTFNANAYFYGACFHAGDTEANSLDKIYFVWKNADDTYELRSIDFNASTGAVSNETTIYGPTRKILYRPKMVQGGNRRLLFFYEADEWWSYTTYSAVTRFIDLTV